MKNSLKFILLLVIIISFLNCEQEEVIVQQENNALKETLLKAKKINEKSPKDFGGDIKNWAEWLDENDTNIGVIDTIYDFKYAQLSFNSHVILEGTGTIKNTFPMKLAKGISIDGVTFERSSTSTLSLRHGYVFYGYDLGDISVTLKNVNSSENRQFIHLTANSIDIDITNNIHEDNLKGAIYLKGDCSDAIFSYNTIKNSLDTSTYTGVYIGGTNTENMLITYNEFNNLTIDVYGVPMHTLLVEGNNTYLMHNDFINCQRGYYTRGNDIFEYDNLVSNPTLIAEYQFINKGANYTGRTRRQYNTYSGKAYRIGELDGKDNQLFLGNTYNVIPSDVVVNGVTRVSNRGLVESNTFRASTFAIIRFTNESWTINGNGLYHYLNLRGNNVATLECSTSVYNNSYLVNFPTINQNQ